MSNIFGRQVIVLLTNKSGGAVVAGDVVVPDGSNDSAFTTTTSAAVITPVWVVQESIANNATGRVLIGGYAGLVNVNASVTRGNYGATHTVAKQAASAGASRTAGTFCRFLTGGTTPIAYVYPTDLLGTSLTNPMSAKGEMIVGDTGGTPSALAAGAAGAVLTGAGAGAFPVWAAAPGFAIYTRTSSDYTTTSTSFVDIDATNLNFTITTKARRVRCVLQGGTNNAATGIVFELLVDGAAAGGGTAGIWYNLTNSSDNAMAHIEYLTPVLTAASHTFKWQWKTQIAGTVTLRAGTAAPSPPLVAYVEETDLTV